MGGGRSKLKEIEKLRGLSLSELAATYRIYFGQDPESRNRSYIFKKLAYRIQQAHRGGDAEPGAGDRTK